jgi:hypothetical protein
MSDQTAVVITLKDVYDEVVILNKRLAPLLDPDVGVIAKQQDHETRLRRLEMKVYAVPGVMTLLSAAGLAWSVFGK